MRAPRARVCAMRVVTFCARSDARRMTVTLARRRANTRRYECAIWLSIRALFFARDTGATLMPRVYGAFEKYARGAIVDMFSAPLRFTAKSENMFCPPVYYFYCHVLFRAILPPRRRCRLRCRYTLPPLLLSTFCAMPCLFTLPPTMLIAAFDY